MKLTILGIPLEKQSARFAKRGKFMMSYQPKKITNWVAQARMQILEQLPQDWKPLDGNVIITKLEFIFPPLKSWSKKKLKTLQDGGLIYKTTKPDLDNLQKNIYDACNGIVWIDDARIVEIQSIRKIYGDVPRIELEVLTDG